MTSISRQEFLEQRRLGIGGSDAAAIVGLNPFTSALDVYREKIGEAAERPLSPALLRGRHLEHVAVDLFCEITGHKVRRQTQRSHPEYPFLIANIDRQILAPPIDVTPISSLGGTGLLEVKCPGVRTFLRYQREGLPAYIVCQGQHYLGVTGYEWMSFALFNADLWKLIHFEIARDELFIAGLFDAEKRFWHEYVEKRVPPPEEGMLHMALPELDLPPTDSPIITRDDPPFLDAVDSFTQARTLRETAESLEEAAIARLKEVAGERGVYEGGNLRFYWKEQGGKKSFDRKALEGSRPLDALNVAAAINGWWENLPEPRYDDSRLTTLLATLGETCVVDFAAYEKVGKPFETFRPFFLKPGGAEDE